MVTSSQASRTREHPRGLYCPLNFGVDWDSVSTDARIAIVITNSLSKAAELCALGQPALAAIGMTEREAVKMFEEHGASVVTKTGTH